jgi:protoporphyrinogen/coproporphyrinogen III oxidase
VSEGFEPIDVAVVGGGISGLACALWAKRKGRTVALFESSPDVGGSITTHRNGRYIADGGPQSFLVSEAFSQLVRDAGLESHLLPSAPEAATPYIYHSGRLHIAPRSPQRLIATSLLSPLAKLRLLAEPLVSQSLADDESVASFVRRRAGGAVLDRLVAPFVTGVYAGDPAALSVRSAFPIVAQFEREHGSIIRGAMRMRKKSQTRSPSAAAGRRQSVGFAGGNDVLPRTLAIRLGADFTVNAPVKAMWQRGRWMELLVGGQTADDRVIAKVVVLATPARAAGTLLEPFEPAVAAALRAIDYPPVVQIAMAYPKNAIGVALDGFGFLTTRSSGLRILGCVWNSAMFPDRCPPDELLLTVFLGGSMDAAIVGHSDEELARIAHEDVSRAMRIKDASPKIVAGFRWQEAIAQYTLGHAVRKAAIESGLARLPQVRLCGNYLRGPSVPDCIALAREVATAL